MLVPVMTSNAKSTLSARGAELAAGPNVRDMADKIFAKPWDPEKNPDGLINLGTAENYLMLDDVAEFIKSQDLHLDGTNFDYGEGPWGSHRIRNALSNFINNNFNPHTQTKADNITITNGCSPLFNALGLTLADPGDGILLTKPSYVAFPSDFGAVAKMTPIFVPFDSTDQFEPESISCYEKALTRAREQGITVRVLLLCNPHNPLGRCYPPATLISLLKFCARNKIHLIADEIYAMSVYRTDPSSDPPEYPFTSILSLNWQQYIPKEYMHHAYGMSKDLAAGGLRIGCLWTLNSELQRAVSTISGFHWSGTINDILTCTILENDEWLSSFLSTSRKRLGEANALARELLDEVGIEYYQGTNAGFYLWIYLGPWLRERDGESGWEREEKLMQRMMGEKVFVMGGRMQSAEEPGWFRFVFARDERMVREGFSRLKKVCGIS